NCDMMEMNTRTALENLGKEIEIGHVTDFAEIAQYGVMSTPALVIDGEVVTSGKVLTAKSIEELIKEKIS
ncbi:thioredoxin family protein, partial [Rhodovulum adriaticum]|uniref:thioredoxin family protein n=1 Tax=Rhodovulum adriaticum TaxID=35804 RepID=UPI001908AE49